MNTQIIYKLIFSNNKIRIGQTIQNFDKRMNQYKKDAYNKNSKNYNLLISRAIRKYGWDNIEKEILCTVSEEFVDDAERYFIKLYNSNNRQFGYNIESGGRKNKIITEKTKEKLRKINLGKKYSKETKEKQRNIKLGKKQSKEHVENRIKSQLKPIDVYIKKIDKYVKTFESIKQASIELKLDDGNICKVLKNKQKSTSGYIFKYNLTNKNNIYI